MKRKIAIALMSLGTLCVVLATGLLVYNQHESGKAKESSTEVLTSLRQHLADNELVTENTDPFDEEMKIVNIDGYGYIGYLSVPALDLDLPVMADIDYGRLKIAPCRYYGSTKTDNLVIAAHNYQFHFGYLGKLKSDDVITFTDMDNVLYRYRVTAIETLPPTAVNQVKDTGDDLVLYTCTYSGSKRIVVRCRIEE